MQGLHTIISSNCYKLLLQTAKDKQNPLQKNITAKIFPPFFKK